MNRPVVFACAGCSLAGRLAYDVALELDRQGAAEMSCLAGLASRKRPFVNKIRGRETWIVDGCPIECSLGVLQGLGLEPDKHIRLHLLGVKKNEPSLSAPGVDQLVEQVLKQVAEAA
jgi:uncharacterized metal-binding protein